MPTFTLRLPDEDYEALQAISLLTGRAMAELVRDAVTTSINRFAASGEMERSYEAEIEARREAMNKLAKWR